MATNNSTTTSAGNGGNDARYVSENHLSDAWMFLANAMRLVDPKDSLAGCLLDKAMSEIIAAQDYLEAMDPMESTIDPSVVDMLSRIGGGH